MRNLLTSAYNMIQGEDDIETFWDTVIEMSGDLDVAIYINAGLITESIITFTDAIRERLDIDPIALTDTTAVYAVGDNDNDDLAYTVIAIPFNLK